METVSSFYLGWIVKNSKGEKWFFRTQEPVKIYVQVEISPCVFFQAYCDKQFLPLKFSIKEITKYNIIRNYYFMPQ